MRLPARKKMGTRARHTVPKRMKADEKENTSAQWPIAEGRIPAPRTNPTSITNETAMPRICKGKRSEITVNPTGKRQATDAACKNMITGVMAGPRRNPNKRVKLAVAERKKVMDAFVPKRVVIHPDENSTTIPKTRESPIRVLAQVRCISISLTR